MPLHQPPGGIREAAVTHEEWQRALPAQDAVPGRRHACDLRVDGFHGPPSDFCQSADKRLRLVPVSVNLQQIANSTV